MVEKESLCNEPAKGRKIAVAEIRPRWLTPPFPALTFNVGTEDLVQLLEMGEVPFFEPKPPERSISKS